MDNFCDVNDIFERIIQEQDSVLAREEQADTGDFSEHAPGFRWHGSEKLAS